MTQGATDVAIIGAGPYGLSLAAHLSHHRVNHRIFGFPMSSWRQMPPGMFLKSFGFATSIPTPEKHYTLPEYCRERGLEDFEPIATAAFADYGDWFQQQLVPYLEQVRVTDVLNKGAGFELTLESGEQFTARRVVVATGLGYFPRIPEVFATLPKDRVTHGWNTSDYLKTGQCSGRDVTIIGSGQTALEAAALLREAGATVRILARRDVWWSDRFAERSLKDRLLNPNTVIGPGRKNWVIEHFPMYPYYMQPERRVQFVRSYLGPLGAWWLRDRVDGKVPVFRKTTIDKATMKNDRIVLDVRVEGEARQLETDHIVSATGYEPDVDRLPFLSRPLAAAVKRIERAPALSPAFESSVSGLYFIGPVAAYSFGPLVRFVAGSYFAIPRVTRHLVKSLAAPAGRDQRAS